MLFYQKEFLLFIAGVLLFLTVVRNHRLQKLFLLAASYYFYAYWDWRFLGLVLLITVVDFTIGQLLKRLEDQARRKLLVVVSVCLNLFVLGFFKYFNFFVESFSPIAAAAGFHVQTLSIILPVGISFYTFQSMSYTIDVYRRDIHPCDDFFDFALGVAFFPQILSGPIVRSRDFLPQLVTPRSFSLDRFLLGGQQFTYGLFKKVFIADRLAQFVDPVFADPGVFSGPTIWLAALSYSIQIYCDFGGYSDMAIGVARIMGYDFKQNFDWPYLSKTIDEFWRRWHMSLSSWLRDYLYISLGGNRYGSLNTYRNLMLTMLLGGLWHGAAWTFVAWGGLHGGALAVARAFKDRAKSRPRSRMVDQLVGISSRWLTLTVVLLGWVLFRADSFHTASVIVGRMLSMASGVSWIHPFAAGVFLLTVTLHYVKNSRFATILDIAPDRWYTASVMATMVLLVLLFYPEGFRPFIYFQF